MPSDKNPLKCIHGPRPLLKKTCVDTAFQTPSYSNDSKVIRIALVVIELSFLTKFLMSFIAHLCSRNFCIASSVVFKKIKWEQTIEICLEFTGRDFGNIFYSTKIIKWRFVSSLVNYKVINIYQLFSHLLFCLYLALWRTSSIIPPLNQPDHLTFKFDWLIINGV